MFDAAFPPSPPPNTDAVAGYIGGNTPHVWTDAEWDAMPQSLRLPIYVCSHPEAHDPNVEADKALQWLWDHRVPTGVWVALDLETAVNPAFVKTFDGKIVASGRLLTIYGSKSTIFQNPIPSGGYWVADWTGVPHLLSRSVITQYASDTMLQKGYDLNVVADSVRLWEVPKMLTEEDIRTLIRLIDHDDANTPGNSFNHRQIAQRLNSLDTRLAVLEASVQTGVPVNLTDTQLETITTKVATKLATGGLKLSGSMVGTIELGADA